MLKTTYHYRLFLHWSIYAGIVAFLIWLSWQLQILGAIFSNDPTKITYVITLLFLGGSLHCGLRSFFLTQQLNSILDINAYDKSFDDHESLPAEFLKTIIKSLHGHKSDDQELPEPDKQLITDLFAEEAHSQHEFGWFITGLLIKLGLLGTVIGFVLMLEPLATMESFDIADIQGTLTNMTAGMSVALNTTLLGLIGSMLLSFQYLLLDRGADELVARTVHFMETELIPGLHSSS